MPIINIDSSQIITTFTASVRSVGTACTLAAVGIYLHRRGFVVGEGKKTLALISQQVTIPLFLFTKVIYCNQDWSDDPCPDIVQSLGDVWMLLLWPAYVVGWGLAVGYVGAKITGTPKAQLRSVLCTCAFANSTGLPITLLTVVHTNFPSTTELGRIDPTLFLSVYLLTYPMLQWSIGGWLLAPDEDHEDISMEQQQQQQQQLDQQQFDSDSPSNDEMVPIQQENFKFRRSVSSPLKHNVLNNKNMQSWYMSSRAGMMDTDASMYISETDLFQMGSDLEADEVQAELDAQDAAGVLPTTLDIPAPPILSERSNLLQSSSYRPYQKFSTRSIEFDADSSWDTLHMIFKRVLQPPVIGAMLGILVAAIPQLRGVFVDVIDRSASAPLQWMFDALYSVGLAAVPLNMMILGINLSQSHLSSGSPKTALLSSETMAAIVIGKMLVMPMIGVASALFCERFLWDIPDDINASFYLVLMIVFITPTANNVMVMVELGGGAREGIARVIAWEYAAAPIMLSLTMTTAVGVASQWS